MYLVVWFSIACLAAFIAHRKKRSAVGCFILSLLAPPLGLMAALLVSPKTEAQGAMFGRHALKLLIGFIPLWAAIGWVLVGSMFNRSADYWNVSPWYIVASIPVSLVLLLVIELFSMLFSNER